VTPRTVVHLTLLGVFLLGVAVGTGGTILLGVIGA